MFDAIRETVVSFFADVRMSSVGESPAFPQSVIPVHKVEEKSPGVCDMVLTAFGVSYWNGREWMSAVTTPHHKIQADVQWWAEMPVFGLTQKQYQAVLSAMSNTWKVPVPRT